MVAPRRRRGRRQLLYARAVSGGSGGGVAARRAAGGFGHSLLWSYALPPGDTAAAATRLSCPGADWHRPTLNIEDF